MEFVGPVEDRTGIVSSCRFDTDRLRVENWNAALRDGGTRSALMAELSALLTPAVTQYLPEPMRLYEGPDEIERWVSARNDESDVFCVRDARMHELLGLLVLGASRDATGALTVRLGFLLAEKAWGKGIATELVKGLVGWCAKQALTGQLLGGVEVENAASAAVLIKAGFARAADMSSDETHTFRLVL
jgi:RimJ/RimL family protein N-acetyltransferase